MKMFFNVAVCCLLGAVSQAQSRGSSSSTTVDINQILSSKGVSNKDKAEHLAVIAEDMAFGTGVTYAQQVADQALRLDSQNVRARAIKATLEPFALMQGFVTRVTPLNPYIKQAGNGGFRSWTRDTRSLPSGPMRDFLYSGSQDINNDQTVEKFSKELQASLRKLRMAYDQLSSENIILNTYVMKPNVTFQQLLRDCQVTEISSNVFSIPSCDLVDRQKKALTYADWQSLKFLVASYQLLLTNWNAYSIDGLKSVLDYKLKYPHASAKKVITEVSKHSNLGRLVDVSALREILSLGAEGAEAMKYAFNHQNDLCPTGEVKSGNRPGFLMTEGFCATQSSLKAFNRLNTGVKQAMGVTFDYYVNKPMKYRSGTYEYSYMGYEKREAFTFLDFTKPLNGSVSNLQSLLPTKFDRCGNATNVGDETMGGLYVRGDFTKISRQQDPNYLKAECH